MKKMLLLAAICISFAAYSQRTEIDTSFGSGITFPYLTYYSDTVEAKIAIYQKTKFAPVLQIVDGYVILNRQISYLDKRKKPFAKHIGIYSFRSKYDEDAY